MQYNCLHYLLLILFIGIINSTVEEFIFVFYRNIGQQAVLDEYREIIAYNVFLL